MSLTLHSHWYRSGEVDLRSISERTELAILRVHSVLTLISEVTNANLVSRQRNYISRWRRNRYDLCSFNSFDKLLLKNVKRRQEALKKALKIFNQSKRIIYLHSSFWRQRTQSALVGIFSDVSGNLRFPVQGNVRSPFSTRHQLPKSNKCACGETVASCEIVHDVCHALLTGYIIASNN